MRHLPVPRSEPIRSLAGLRSVLNAPKCVPDTNSHIKQILFTMFDNGAYDLFYTVCILASEGHALLCPGPPNESRSGNICLTHGNKTETRRWLILLITITSRGCGCVCVCAQHVSNYARFPLLKFDSKWISIKIIFDNRYASKICKRSFTRQTDRQRGLWMSHGADRVADRRTFSWLGKQMQLATHTKRHLIGFRCCAVIGANWRQLVELLTGQKTQERRP